VQWEDQYQDWSRYRSHYNTPETDRDYLLYWKTISEKIRVRILQQSARPIFKHCLLFSMFLN
jgi:RNase P subunit RPR2